MKWLSISCGAVGLLLAVTLYWHLRADLDIAVPNELPVATPAVADDPRAMRSEALAKARRSCDPAQLDAFVAAQQAILAQSPGDAPALRLCAEAMLERVALGNQRRGMTVGEPMYAVVPAAVAADVEAALTLLQRARAAGDHSAENWRIEAALLGNRITGIGSALQWNGRIESALAEAAKVDADDPQLHVTLGLRKLLAPELFGHDPAAALKHFSYAAKALGADERPRVFAAMAAYLLQKRQQAIAWLEQAVAVNPNNVFARAVLVRVRRDEPDPFGRDVAAPEINGK